MIRMWIALGKLYVLLGSAEKLRAFLPLGTSLLSMTSYYVMNR